MNYHAGNVINKYLKDRGISQAWLARKTEYDPGNLYRLLKKPSIPMDMLYKISVALNYNFGVEFTKDIERGMAESAPKTE